jgi:N-acetylmuramoyl-L-alanine amidase
MTGSRAAGDLTRRALLAGAAAAGAVSLTRPSDSLASALAWPDQISGRCVGSVRGESAVLAAPRRFALVAVQWAGPARAVIELRTRAGDGGWSRWAVASVLGHGPDRDPGATAEPGPGTARGAGEEPLFGEAIWTGPADQVQLRSDRDVRGVRLHFVSAALPRAGFAATAVPLARPVLDAGPGQPPIISRIAWAHRAAPPRIPALYGSVRLAFIHHTETPNGYSRADVPAMLISIYRFHRFVRGWNDIGYNFAIDTFGRIWEARAGGIDEAVVGAQAGAYNTVSTGVAVLGSFTDVVPPAAAIDALERLLAWKLSLHGVPARGRVTVEVDPADAFYTPFAPGAHVSLPRVAGHRDGDATSCPGDAFYARLPSMRPRVAALAGTPARITLVAEPAVVTPGAQVTLSGHLRRLAGPSIPGAAVEVQRVTPRGATTLATATTGADGSWSAVLAATATLLVRALHRLAPAATSGVVALAVAPALTLRLDSASPLRVSGTVSPAKRSVTIDLYALVGGRRRLVASKRVAVTRGRFAAHIRTHRRGPSLLIARTAADAHNAAGASPPVDVAL